MTDRAEHPSISAIQDRINDPSAIRTLRESPIARHTTQSDARETYDDIKVRYLRLIAWFTGIVAVGIVANVITAIAIALSSAASPSSY